MVVYFGYREETSHTTGNHVTHMKGQLRNNEDTSLAGLHGNDTSLAGVPIPMMTNNDDDDLENPITTPLTPATTMTIQAKHPYTALEATYQFTIQLMNHHNILQMRKSQMTYNSLSWKPKFLYYVDPKEFLCHHPTTYPEWEARPMP